MIEELRHLLPKKLDCSVVIVDTWKPLWEAGEKLFEVKMEDLETVLNKLKPTVPAGCFIVVYDREGNLVAEYDPEKELPKRRKKKQEGKKKKRKKAQK
ncbi:MAG: hypothetical protein QXD49_03000 [Archaeoglobaceae archaeon]